MSDEAMSFYFGLGYKPEQRQFVYLAFGIDKATTTKNAHDRGTEHGVNATRVFIAEIDPTKEPDALQSRLLRWLAENDIIGAEAKASSREIWLKMFEVLNNAYQYTRRTR